MKKETNEATPSKEELLNKIEEVLSEALAEFDALQKSEVETPAAPAELAKDESDKKDEEDEDEDKKDKKDEDKKDDDKEIEKSEKSESDDELKALFKSVTEKMEARGLLKSESYKGHSLEEHPMADGAGLGIHIKGPHVNEHFTMDDTASHDDVREGAKTLIDQTIADKNRMTKSEAPAEDKTEVLRKSFDDRFEVLTKAVSELSEVVQKIAAQPASARKGLAGYAPLKKSEGEEESLNKAEVLSKLLDLKKSGKPVDTSLIFRVETGRVSQSDLNNIKRILG